MPNAKKEKRSFDKLRTSGEGEILVLEIVLAALHEASKRAFPQEACGILLGESGVVSRFDEARNVHPTPRTHFEIDPQALIDAHRTARGGGEQILGYFHSHPTGPAKPSETDQKQAAGDGMLWAIWGENTLAFWRDAPSGFRHISYTLADG